MKISRCIFALLLSACALNSAQASPMSVAQGQYLAQAGGCTGCHTAVDSQPFAGGLAIKTPVGVIYSTNITPDRATGIGRYSYFDFAQAVRRGVAKDGTPLYPAMPYPSYARINERDMHSLYDYFMQGVKPVRRVNRDSDIPWPLSIRWPLSVWHWAFADETIFLGMIGLTAQWQRGAYLVQGLAHCGACHTPRGAGFQEKALDQSGKEYLTGSTINGWHAPNLTGGQTGLGSWSQQDIVDFLKTGDSAQSSASGPMADVVNHSTKFLTDNDLQAIAIYLKSLPAANSQ